MGELTQQKAEIEARLAEVPVDLPDVHPNFAEHYRAKAILLAEALARRDAKLHYMGHATMENRHGRAVAGMVTDANGTVER